jgi:hypothetical protein
MVDVLETQARKVYKLYERGESIPIVDMDSPDRTQKSMRTSPMTYDHLIMVKAKIMLEHRMPISFCQVIHSIVVDGLAEFE